MKKKDKRIHSVILILALLFVISVFIAVSYIAWAQYDEEWAVGKTRDEIQSRWGQLDYCYTVPDTDWLALGGYVTTDMFVYIFDAGEPDKYFMVWFDETGVAIRAQKNFYFPGG